MTGGGRCTYTSYMRDGIGKRNSHRTRVRKSQSRKGRRRFSCTGLSLTLSVSSHSLRRSVSQTESSLERTQLRFVLIHETGSMVRSTYIVARTSRIQLSAVPVYSIRRHEDVGNTVVCMKTVAKVQAKVLRNLECTWSAVCSRFPRVAYSTKKLG